MIEKPARDLDKYILRLPDGMRDRLKVAADEHKRSLNAEIVARLEATLQGDALQAQGLSPSEIYRQEFERIYKLEMAKIAAETARAVMDQLPAKKGA